MTKQPTERARPTDRAAGPEPAGTPAFFDVAATMDMSRDGLAMVLAHRAIARTLAARRATGRSA